jgi:hypothetical protein
MKNLFWGILILANFSLFAQEHNHPEIEIGLSNGLVYNFSEKEPALGIHLHLIKSLGQSDHFGMGLGYEFIFDDHKHNTVSIIFLYRPIEHLSFNMAPGISFILSEKSSVAPTLHIEGLYEFEFGHFHIGPLVGFAISTEDIHASVGLHLAFGF